MNVGSTPRTLTDQAQLITSGVVRSKRVGLLDAGVWIEGATRGFRRSAAVGEWKPQDLTGKPTVAIHTSKPRWHERRLASLHGDNSAHPVTPEAWSLRDGKKHRSRMGLEAV